MELDVKRIIEAALFMSPDPLDINYLAKISGLGAIGYVNDLIEELNKEYNERKSAITIKKIENSYQMTLRSEYFDAVAGLAKETEIRSGALKVLAYIHKHGPILQSELKKIFGSSIYDYVKELKEKGFISAEKKGISKVLKTTKRFKDYFDLKEKSDR